MLPKDREKQKKHGGVGSGPLARLVLVSKAVYTEANQKYEQNETTRQFVGSNSCR